MSSASIELRTIRAEETWPLRRAILRPDQPPETARYPEDDREESRHFGGFAGVELVGIASIYREPRPGVADPGAFRLRGMATAPEVRGRGYGAALLGRCIDDAASRGGSELWCNARETASGFYLAVGFEVLEGPFPLPGIGPHFLMRRALAR